MTTIVKKGANRPAHTAKTNRHAQRTPLPTQRRTSEEVESDRAALAAAVRPTEAPTAEGRSPAKGKAFADSIRPFGWEITPAWGETGIDDHVTVVATRGAESIFIEWIGGVFQETATYTIGDRTVKLRNASAAKQYAGRSPEEGQAELAKVASNRFFRKRETPKEDVDAQRQPLPFDPALALEDEILTALAGRKLTWHNRFREVAESGIFPVDPRREFCHITEFESERILNFVCPATGFRSLRLSALLSVSRGKSITVKRGQAAAARKAAKAGAR